MMTAQFIFYQNWAFQIYRDIAKMDHQHQTACRRHFLLQETTAEEEEK